MLQHATQIKISKYNPKRFYTNLHIKLLPRAQKLECITVNVDYINSYT